MRSPFRLLPALAGLLSLAALLAATPVAADAALEEVQACMERNTPKRTSTQTLRFRSMDRLGGETQIRAMSYGKRFEDGLRKLVTRFSEPADVRGSALLIEQKEEGNEMFLYTPELRRTRRISARAAAGSLFGTDFSYEDFQRLQGLQRRSETGRLKDAELDGRPVYVLESRPAEEDGSRYENVVSYVDRKTCVALKVESYESGGRLRKVLTADPEQVLAEGGVWVARDLLMKDLRDRTHTRLIVEKLEVDRPISDKRFRLAELERRGH